MKKLYVLVGIPASGKSTWVQNQDWKDQCEVISTDDYVEAYAKEVGKTYSEVFDDYMPTAVELMLEKVERARDAGKDIIWDQTNTGRKSRKAKLAMAPGYHKIAVVFATPEEGEWQRRLASRPGKAIPDAVLKAMATGLQLPTEDEFDEIWYAQ